MSLEQEFFYSFLTNHFRQFFEAPALQALSEMPVIFSQLSQLDSIRTPGLVVVEGLPLSESPSVKRVEVFGVEIHLLDCFEPSEVRGFYPVSESPLFFRNSEGVTLLSWNLMGVMLHYLRFVDETDSVVRDEHGRVPIEASSLKRLGLLDKPIINEYMFVVLAAALGFKNKLLLLDPCELVKSPMLVLSHDCDQLRGNDFYTQAIRLYRTISPMLRFKPPEFRNLLWIIRNWLQPYKFYTDDLLAMLKLEQSYEYRSSCYLLNGEGGRFGARSGLATIKRFAQLAPSTSMGAHYNYKYALKRDKLHLQLDELKNLDLEIASGRAHYLTFQPPKSFEVLRDLGIRVDESIGFAEESSFRVGYAGAFEVWDLHGPIGVTEIPLVFMDANVARPFLQSVYDLLGHIEKIGGTITLLFHPGTYDSPEFSDLQGVYDDLLAYFSKKGYRNMLPLEIHSVLAD